MARIRTIKPEFWELEALANLPFECICTFIAMKNFCDDRGVIIANAKLILSKCFPLREDLTVAKVEKILSRLQECGLLSVILWEEKVYFQICFKDERIDKPQPSILPEAAFLQGLQHDSNSIPGMFSNAPAGKERKGEERKGKDLLPQPQEYSCTAVVSKLLLSDKDSYELREDDMEFFKPSYPGVDIKQEFLKMQAWCNSNPKKCPTRKGVRRFVNQWLNRQQDGIANKGARNGNYESASERGAKNLFEAINKIGNRPNENDE